MGTYSRLRLRELIGQDPEPASFVADEFKLHREFECLREGLADHKSSSLYYHLIFVFRRICFVLPIFLATNFACLQFQLFCLVSFGNFVFLLLENPLTDRVLLRLELFNEFCVFLCGLHSIYFITNSEDSFFSVSLITLIIIMLAVNMLVIFGGLLLTCIKGRKIKKQKDSMLKKQAKFNAVGFEANGDRKRSNHVWA